jgi:hypothetical protein
MPALDDGVDGAQVLHVAFHQLPLDTVLAHALTH